MIARRINPALITLIVAIASWLALGLVVWAHPNHIAPDGLTVAGERPEQVSRDKQPGTSRGLVLVASLTVFVLAVFVGFEVINKVPPTLHTPLMSGSNAISGITVVGAILASGTGKWGFATVLGVLAIALANINVVGGFLVTHRMLLMFKKR